MRRRVIFSSSLMALPNQKKPPEALARCKHMSWMKARYGAASSGGSSRTTAPRRESWLAKKSGSRSRALALRRSKAACASGD
ncbi:MAG: hypothetical protein MUF64_09155 [Polyangiaceae bacterium]|nr:hypothetical protein [Polyangiaceae bacterium]